MTLREEFEEMVRANQGLHGMIGDLTVNADGEYRSACERSAWWGFQMARTTPGLVVITESDYDSLTEDARWLCALENAGVDNWEGYRLARHEMLKEDEEE